MGGTGWSGGKTGQSKHFQDSVSPCGGKRAKCAVIPWALISCLLDTRWARESQSALIRCPWHPQVVKLKAVFPHGAGFVLAFEFMLSDLSEVIRHGKRPLAPAQVKAYMQMLLKGVAFCHANNIVHRVWRPLVGLGGGEGWSRGLGTGEARVMAWPFDFFLPPLQDLKPANLLISSSGQLKIADFGLARVFSHEGDRLYSHQVATRWYRAPELLYGARQYGEGVDLWAVGCILGELLNGSPLFPGENDIEQLCCVLRVLGTPSPKVWPEITELPDYNKISFKEQLPLPLDDVLPDASPPALHLLGRFLVYPPRQRIQADQALLHEYFFRAPLPAHPSELPIPQRGGGPGPKARPGPPHVHDFRVEQPLAESLPDPELIRPYLPEG
uniref:Cyclin-dependent kinase 20 n=1 Tax=Monodelphis domestica TaxID=13616 RepID=A0A5F8H2V8_MONDO